MDGEANSNKSSIPPMVAWFAARTGSRLIQRDIRQRPYMLAGPMFFTFSYWLFQTGGLLGFGLRGHIEIISKLIFEAGADTGEVLRYLEGESAALISKSKNEPVSLLELYLVPLLASVGIDFYDKEFIDGKNSGWAAEKQYDMDTLDKNAYLAFRQGVSIGYCHPAVFQSCWQGTYAPKSKEEWDEAFKKDIVDSPTQEILRFEDEVSRVLAEVAEWAEKNKDAGISKSEIEEIRRMAGEDKSP
jgi:hypothetical protein